MGVYTKITDIVAPSNAAQGSRVDVTVKVKNIDTTFYHWVACVAIYDGSAHFIDEDVFLGPGKTHSFSGRFTMPNKAITITAYSYYDYYGEWIPDDEASKAVALAEVFKGKISKKELEYDEARASIPAYNIPQNKRGLVHIWGRNDMTTTQRMGIWWQVKDPGGKIVEEYATWEALPYTSPGSAHEFMGGRFNLDKVGTYTIAVQLFMNPADEVVVDDYYGTLCTVKAVIPEPEFSGFAVSDYSKL